MKPPDPKHLPTLSDRFMASVAIAALKPATAGSFADRIDAGIKEYADTLNPEKKADMEHVVNWLRKVEKGE